MLNASERTLFGTSLLDLRTQIETGLKTPLDARKAIATVDYLLDYVEQARRAAERRQKGTS